MLPPDFFTINSSTIDWRQMLIMMAWNHTMKLIKSDLLDMFLKALHNHIWRSIQLTAPVWHFTCWLVMVTHCSRSLLIRYSKASSSLTSHLEELQGLVVPLVIGTCCRVDHKYGELVSLTYAVNINLVFIYVCIILDLLSSFKFNAWKIKVSTLIQLSFLLYDYNIE